MIHVCIASHDDANNGQMCEASLNKTLIYHRFDVEIPRGMMAVRVLIDFKFAISIQVLINEHVSPSKIEFHQEWKSASFITFAKYSLTVAHSRKPATIGSLHSSNVKQTSSQQQWLPPQLFIKPIIIYFFLFCFSLLFTISQYSVLCSCRAIYYN